MSELDMPGSPDIDTALSSMQHAMRRHTGFTHIQRLMRDPAALGVEIVEPGTDAEGEQGGLDG